MYLLAINSLTLLHGSPGNSPILVSKLQEHLAVGRIALTLFLPVQLEYHFPISLLKASVNPAYPLGFFFLFVEVELIYNINFRYTT